MSWTPVCKVDDISINGTLKCEVNGTHVLVLNYDGGIRVVPPICPHMEEPLEDSGTVSNCILTCTKHLWQWDLRTLELLGPAEAPLKIYENKIENGNLLIWFEKELVYEFEEEEELDEDDFFD